MFKKFVTIVILALHLRINLQFFKHSSTDCEYDCEMNIYAHTHIGHIKLKFKCNICDAILNKIFWIQNEML